MRTFLYYSQLVCLFSVFWIALFEKISLFMVFSAPSIALLVILISEKFFLKDRYIDLYYFNSIHLLGYGLLLVWEIYKAGLAVLPYIISGKANPTILSIHTELEDNLEIALITNSITLTPGTISLDVRGQNILVLWINPTTKEPTIAGRKIKGRLEDYIKKRRGR